MHAQQDQPLARTDGLLVEQLGAESVVFDTESNSAHCLAPLAAAVFTAADGRNGVAELAAAASSSTGEPVGVQDVEAALMELDELGLMVAPPSGMTRRSMIGRTAAATAVATAAPLVTSIAAPAAAATLLLNCPGSKCSTSSEGDAYCGCANTCPPAGSHQNSSTCIPFDGTSRPFYDSCECEQCPYADAYDDPGSFPGATDAAKIALGLTVCEPLYGANYYKNDPTQPISESNWKDWTTDCSQADVNANWRYGCKDAGKAIDGACYDIPGDTSFDGQFCDTST